MDEFLIAGCMVKNPPAGRRTILVLILCKNDFAEFLNYVQKIFENVGNTKVSSLIITIIFVYIKVLFVKMILCKM